MALKRLRAQMSDAVPLQVLGPGEGLSTALLSADKATVIFMFPDRFRATDSFILKMLASVPFWTGEKKLK